MIQKINGVFWEREKLLAFFFEVSLCLVVLSMFNSGGEKCVDFLPYYWISAQEYGILTFSIFLGFLSLWLYSIKEREKDFSILKMLGITQMELQRELQLELLKFQIKATSVPVVLYIVFLFTLGERISVLAVIESFFRIHFDLQILLGVIGWFRLRQIKISVSEP